MKMLGYGADTAFMRIAMGREDFVYFLDGEIAGEVRPYSGGSCYVRKVRDACGWHDEYYVFIEVHEIDNGHVFVAIFQKQKKRRDHSLAIPVASLAEPKETIMPTNPLSNNGNGMSDAEYELFLLDEFAARALQGQLSSFSNNDIRGNAIDASIRLSKSFTQLVAENAWDQAVEMVLNRQEAIEVLRNRQSQSRKDSV